MPYSGFVLLIRSGSGLFDINFSFNPFGLNLADKA
jgi:hypothetical protein